MKLALITDSHFGSRGDSEVFHKYFEKFYTDTFFPYLLKNGIKEVIHLGDQFDRRKYVNFVTLQRCKQYFYDKLVQYDRSLNAIIGNHDVSYKNTNSVNSPNLLLTEYSKNLTNWWDKPVEVVYDGLKILLCPWICEDNYADTMKAIEETDARVLMGHLELQGFEMHRGSICDHGQTADTFAKFDLVCSGHFHHKSTHDNIAYLGSPYEMTWNDYGDPRGFHIFDTDTRAITFVRNPYSIFHKIEYSDADMTIEDIGHLETNGLTGTYIKVIVKEKTNPYLFDLFIDKLQQSGAADIKVVDDHLNLDLADDSIVDEAQDTLTIMNKYIETIEFRGDKKRVEHFIRELYQEAVNL
jgi:UDP-2,3-diacylglucosamine pyrophosphatase LpxH